MVNMVKVPNRPSDGPDKGGSIADVVTTRCTILHSHFHQLDLSSYAESYTIEINMSKGLVNSRADVKSVIRK